MILSLVPTLRQKNGHRRVFVRSTATLRYEPCPQFINVSQRTLHIYWQFAAMSHAIHKIVSKKNAANLISYRGVRRITAKVKTVICEQAPNHGPYFAYARLIARVTFNLPYFFRNQFCPRHSESGAVCYPLGSNVGHACSIIRNRTVS